MPIEEEVSLLVGGKRHDGWQSVTIRQNIEELAPMFTVDYSQRWSTDDSPVPIKPDDAVDVLIGGVLVLSGYVDDCSEDYDASSHSVTCTGRSRTGDLVDCAAIYQTGSLAGKNLLQIAAALGAPFGITATATPGLDIGDPVAQFQVQDGQTVFEALGDIARQEGILLLSTPSGDLLLARAATVPSGLALTSDNIKRGSLRNSHRNRFSTYILKGQAPPATKLKGVAATQLKTTIADDEVARYRPTVILDHQTTLPRLKQRAVWERNTRAGAASAFTYDVVGWTHAQGLWQINTLVHVSDAVLGVDTDLLITGVDFQRNLDQGRATRLELMPRETFDVLKPPRLPKRKRKKKGALSAALGL